MRSSMFVFLVGAAFVYYQVLAVDDHFVAELMIESNITLTSQTVLSILKATEFSVTAGNENVKVHLVQSEIIAVCVIVGDDITCNCSAGYIWSNQVCDQYGCCRETACPKNVSHVTPLCLAKIEVRVNGSVTLSDSTWGTEKTTQLTDAFKLLNGYEDLNVTGQRLGDTVADFEAALSVKFLTSKLQQLVTSLENSLSAVILIDTKGLVVIKHPAKKVCYLSSPNLTCTFDEKMDSNGWNKSSRNERFELNTGSVVKLTPDCSTTEIPTCTSVTLEKVTGVWEGMYECGFTTGSIRHTASAYLSVALLPDKIDMKTDPITVDCSKDMGKELPLSVTATILNTTEAYEVCWSMTGEGCIPSTDEHVDGENKIFRWDTQVTCEEIPEGRFVKVSFKNPKAQSKSAIIEVPVLYAGATFCNEEVLDEQIWPKTPSGDTAINRTCPENTVGYTSRTCTGAEWEPVFSYCVNEELNKVVDAAENFLQGLGATQEVARDIFSGLKNSTKTAYGSGDTVANVNASISVLNKMSSASKNIKLQEDILPDLVNAASNMLNASWAGVNVSLVYDMSSTYLQSVEYLVKNIQVNNTRTLNSENLELKFCEGRSCNLTVFGTDVDIANKSRGMMKTVGIKNLMEKLPNNFEGTERTSLLVSTTLEGGSNDSTFKIKMNFPKEKLNFTHPICVFWNTTGRKWSQEGCKFQKGDSDDRPCVCNHLTSFSVLMSKRDISTYELDIITQVGMGVSICCLVIFLIIEFLVWSAVVKSNLSYFRHTTLVNIAVFLLLGDICFLASSEPEMLSDTLCFVFTICKHLFFLAMFSWMLVMSAMLVHQLIFVFSPLRKRVFMFLSSFTGYVCPILIVGASYTYCKYTGKDYYKPKTCWLVFDRLLEGSMHAFLIPIGTVILTNIFSMMVVIVTLVKSSTPDHSKSDDKETLKSILKVVVFLTPVFGVTWIIGFALLMLEDGSPMFHVANYAFTILNSFQGLFLLVTGCFAEQKVREEVVKLITGKGKKDGTTLSSTMYTKEK